MTPEMFAKLKKSLINHEGFKRFPYTDTTGNITIGIGYNVTTRGLDDDWINAQYEKDVNYFYTNLNNDFPWFERLNEDRQIVLIDMCFMGYKKFKSFQKLIAALSRDDYKQAALEMLDSNWATQVKNRATTLAHGMLTGVYKI